MLKTFCSRTDSSEKFSQHCKQAKMLHNSKGEHLTTSHRITTASHPLSPSMMTFSNVRFLEAILAQVSTVAEVTQKSELSQRTFYHRLIYTPRLSRLAGQGQSVSAVHSWSAVRLQSASFEQNRLLKTSEVAATRRLSVSSSHSIAYTHQVRPPVRSKRAQAICTCALACT